MSEYHAQTNETEIVKLSSGIEQVRWRRNSSAPEGEVGLEIRTRFVGNGADLEIELSDHSGKKYEKFKENITGNRFWALIRVPEKARDALYADVKLPKHGLKQKSPPLLIIPPVAITNVKWSEREARRGDVLKLTADVKGAPDGTDAELVIWEHDADDAHDLVTKFNVLVEKHKVEAEWEYEYHEDTDDIPTKEESEKGYNPPEYFFRVTVHGVSADSELLTFKDWIDIELKNQFDIPIPEENYVLRLPDGTERKGKLDKDGRSTEKDVPPGKTVIEFPDL